MPNPIVDIIIISFNSARTTLDCIESIHDTVGGDLFRIIVVDNNSSDNTIELITGKYPQTQIIGNDTNLGYAAAVNIGVNHSLSEYLIISNSDVIYHKDSIKNLIDYLRSHPDVGAAGPQQVYSDGSWEYSYGSLPGVVLGLKDLFLISLIERGLRRLAWRRFRIDRKPKEVGYIDGGVMAISKSEFIKTGGFDEDYFFYSEEADFCYRLAARSVKVVFNPDSIVTHLRGKSIDSTSSLHTSTSMMVKGQLLFCEKHRSDRETSLFILLERLHNLEMKLIWWIMRFISFGRLKRISKRNVNFFGMRYDVWKRISQ